ncbi:VanZ like family protein [Flavobacterium terrigena]|uniref:VanZ like family protein n=1 Tax=Flavobacterium terrigena TaxID=402734 RepID=A0A1H6V3X7_9FLAO|nr:VanZ like family protein [Flavobacterium terrigena]
MVHNLFKILAIFWTLLIFYLCLDDVPNVPKITFQYKDKVVHFIFYFIFVYFWTKSLKNKTLNYILTVLFLALVMGISIEFMQESFTLHRTFDWYDILANSIGAIASFIYVKKFYAIKN